MARRQTEKQQAFDPEDLAPKAAEGRVLEPAQDSELHLCPSCRSNLVYPTDWSPAAMRRWSVQLRCPDCEWNGAGTYDQSVVDRFDEALDRGTEAVLDDLKLLARANMEEHVERFVDALWADHIVPEDF
jgi:predicted RNA-binding Zn-ribbon protein involved in translation (DUF1610 family)